MIYTNDAIKKRKNMEKKVKNTIAILFYILLIPILIYNISLIAQAIINSNETPSFLGIKTYIVISESMKPALNIGDIVIVKNVEKDELQEGDIISFREGQSVVTHRISQIINTNDTLEYKTKGDNNNAEDSGTIVINLIEGKVIKKIPFIGKIVLALQNKVAIIWILIILYIYIYNTNIINKRKESRRIKRIEYEKTKGKNVISI